MQPSGSPKKAVFLDRDGVINRAPIIAGIPQSPKSLHELEINNGVEEAINLLRKKGFELVVVTNQPDIARGKLNSDVLTRIHESIANKTGVKHFFSCIHDEIQNCECRKPKPGLILQATSQLNLDLKRSFLVGDRWKDIQAGQTAGCTCFFIDYGYDEAVPQRPYYKVASLLEAAIFIGENYGVDKSK